MTNEFGRNISILRKERCLSQKQTALSLGVSQSLLSHYEKGVRECGLDFLIKCADFYNVSTDFLLGRTNERSGAIINLDEFPDVETEATTSQSNTLMPTLNKKIITNSINFIYEILIKLNNRKAVSYVSSYLSLSVYKIIRKLYSANKNNPQDIFAIEKDLFDGFASGEMNKTEAKLDAQLKAAATKKGSNTISEVELSPDIIALKYSQYSSSVYNLIKNSEKKLK